MEISVIQDVLEESNAVAKENRKIFDLNRVFVVNMMSSPGSGKTSILQRTIPVLQNLGLNCAVIEGDITSTIDSERLQPLGIQIVQANTEPFGGDCHIGSHLIKAALEYLDLTVVDILFIENIGNLVCPAEFYLGEDCKVVVLSVAEGEDKPLKYPLMFRECRVCMVSKIDMIPYLDFDLSLLEANIQKVNGQLEVLFNSAKTGEGISTWVDWLLRRMEDRNDRK